MSKTITVLFVYLLLICINIIAGLELADSIFLVMLVYGFAGTCAFYSVKRFGIKKLTNRILTAISIFLSYLFMSGIAMYETDQAFAKINSIPIENLVEFYTTKNVELIPENKRHAWIGIRYKEIGIVSENRTRKINAAGWRGSSVFAYYDIDEKIFAGSYH